ncbi:uncharacterized protein LOC129906596 [Episyrphus balteatus]|uniref:uncharacterized protein LOC129906596 n=1 Tax=Episyrphus balteatus TaxID=286459 RepID=UPI0024863BF1|nr:uncharacterized protein LOC129906596 [Episyrphus balteatus]
MSTIKICKFIIFFVVSASVAKTLAQYTIGVSDNTRFDICEIPFSSKVLIGYQWPLVFNINGSLYDSTPVDGVNLVAVSHGKEVILSCSPNFILSSEKLEQIHARCGEDGHFQLNGRKGGEHLKNLTCDLRVIEETVTTVHGCPINLTSTHFGYVHPINRQTYVLGESCYDLSAGKTYFAHIKMGSQTQYLKNADKTYLLHNHPNSKYKFEFFKALRFDDIYERVRRILGIKEAPGFKLSNFVDEPLLVHSQLIAVKKLSWNYFLIRDSLLTLTLLKEDIRDLSNNIELDVFIGSHGVNILQNSNGVQMEFYAEVGNGQNRFPMPELIWILVKAGDKVVTFGVFNDPDVTSEDVARKSICRSECEKITWLTRITSSRHQGPLICCQYNDFIKVVREVPLLSGINNLFTSLY